MRFHLDAEREFDEGVLYYTNVSDQLGREFSELVRAALHKIEKHPTSCPILEERVRYCLTRKFPYKILYSVKPSEIFILAVMHNSRRPGYWKYRLWDQ